jgi:AcrR family transcriptional regulator
MKKKKDTAREKILVSAINQIEKEGVHSITTRKIAKLAGVNIAAINYYFGTKEKLISEALEYTLDQAFSDSEAKKALDARGSDIYPELRRFFLHIFSGAIQYPGITKAHILRQARPGGSGNEAAERFNAFLASLLKRLKKRPGANRKADLKLSLIQIVSAVMFPAFMPDAFRGFSGYDFRKKGNREKYVSHLLRSFFG